MDKRKLILGLLIFLVVVSVITVSVLLLKRSRSSSGGAKYVWQTAPDPGSVCSVPCGGGVRYLNVWCEAVDANGKDIKQVDNSLCDQSSKPASSETCNTQACQWITGDWSSCSAPCNGGTQTRSATCEISLDPSKCLAPEPPTSQVCNTQACQWDIGVWGDCSQTCGVDGIQTRTVTCPSGETCPLPEPPTTQPCDPVPPLCDWTYSDWAPADCVDCGTGTQTRTGTCPRQPSNCGTEGPLSQACTSVNKCVWETGPAWLPFPPSTLNLSNFNQKNIKLINADNQYIGLTAPSGDGVFTLTTFANASVLSSMTYIPAHNILTFIFMVTAMAVNSSNQVGILSSYDPITILGLTVVGNTISPVLIQADGTPIGQPGYFYTNGSILYYSATAPTSNPVTIIPVLS